MTRETPIDADLAKFNAALGELSLSISQPLAEQRVQWEAACRAFRAERPHRLMVEDLDANGVRARVYRPPGEAPKPGVIYFHGGGWVMGSCDTHDDICAEIADQAEVVLVSVAYRLAPEHHHPAQLDDGHTVLDWMRSSGRALGIDLDHIVAAGDSSGGQQAMALALSGRDRGLPRLRGLVLIYPWLGKDMDTQSHRRGATNLSREDLLFYRESFLGPRSTANWSDPLAFPNLAEDLAGMPPVFISAAYHDPLHDDGVIMHGKLTAQGIPAALRSEPALTHSFLRARHHSQAAMDGFKRIVEAIRSLAHEGMLPD